MGQVTRNQIAKVSPRGTDKVKFRETLLIQKVVSIFYLWAKLNLFD